jgi:hypothetical protein
MPSRRNVQRAFIDSLGQEYVFFFRCWGLSERRRRCDQPTTSIEIRLGEMLWPFLTELPSHPLLYLSQSRTVLSTKDKDAPG